MKSKLDEYSIIVDFLSAMLGPNYEIVLHDLKDKEGKIVKIVNGNITGRDIGERLSTFALEQIKNKVYLEKDYILNYNAVAKSGRLLRSSTFFIKEKNKPVGLLCINFDDHKFKDLEDTLRKLIHPDEVVFKRDNPNEDENEVYEVFIDSISDAVKQILDEYFSKLNIRLDTLTLDHKKQLIMNISQKDRIGLIKSLNQKGLFYMKGAINEVAKQLYVSTPTIYRYLNKIK